MGGRKLDGREWDEYPDMPTESKISVSTYPENPEKKGRCSSVFNDSNRHQQERLDRTQLFNISDLPLP